MNHHARLSLLPSTLPLPSLLSVFPSFFSPLVTPSTCLQMAHPLICHPIHRLIVAHLINVPVLCQLSVFISCTIIRHTEEIPQTVVKSMSQFGPTFLCRLEPSMRPACGELLTLPIYTSPSSGQMLNERSCGAQTFEGSLDDFSDVPERRSKW